MQVRQSTPADVPALQALERDAPSAAHWSEGEYQRLFADRSRRVALTLVDDAVCGFIVARDLGPEWEIENVVIANACRRRGLGTLLLRELLEIACNRGAQAVFLEVRESNAAARGLYCNLGFAEIGRRKLYYQTPHEDALVYEKSFRNHMGKVLKRQEMIA